MSHPRRASLLLLSSLLLSLFSSSSWAIGEASTAFLIYVPPNNDNNGRDVCLVVTALNETTTTVDIIDDDADGDSDDTVLQVPLSQGQSYILYHKDGAINDDAGGKWDGDYFKIRADYPVVVQMATRSNWQHDWVPGQNKTSRDTSFFIWAPPSSGEDNDINVYAYEDDTKVEVLDITSSPSTQSGPSTVDLQGARQLLNATLMRGEDLIVRKNLGVDILDPGHTYHVRSSKPVTVQYGHLGSLSGANSVRDGGGFIPSSSGDAIGDTYYFSIPHHPGAPGEKELRVVSYDDDVTFTLMGWNATSGGFEVLDQQSIQAHQHLDYVGAAHPAFRDASLYHVTISPPGKRVTLFEASWLESGSSGTSDYASAVSSSDGHGAGTEFITYLGPPGYEQNWTLRPDPLEARYAHLFLYGLDAQATIQIRDLDTGGMLVNEQVVLARDDYHDVAIDLATYNLMNTSGRRPYLHVTSSAPIAIHNTNFNDNWLTYATSPLRADPLLQATAAAPSLSCGEGTTITVDFGLESSDLNLTDASLAIHLPPGFSAVPATLSSTHPDVLITNLLETSRADGGTTLTFDLLTTGLLPMTTYQLTLNVMLDCASLAGCLDEGLAGIQLSLRGEDATTQEIYASRTQVTLETTRDPFNQVLGLDAYWDASMNAARVGFQVGPEDGTALYEVTRSTSPDGVPTTIAYLSSHGPTTMESVYWFNDHNVLTGQTYYYHVNVQRSDGCVTAYGPLPVYLDASSSSGAQGGLESNGRMADQLALRDIERRFLSPGAPLQHLTDAEDSLPVRLMPAHGPYGSLMVDTTPHDLIHYTNATQVAARDYVDAVTGAHLASVLITYTTGEVYEHSKPLCDRAGGATLERLFDDTLEQLGRHELVRYRLRHTQHGTLDHATSFKLYGPDPHDKSQASQPWVLRSAWLRHDYPTPDKEEQPVLNVQIWASAPGLEMWLAERVIAAAAQSITLAQAPSTGVKNRQNKPYFSSGYKKGQRFEVVVQSPTARMASDCLVRLHELSSETSATNTHDLPIHTLSHGRAGAHTLRFERPPLLDATVQLLCHEQVIDELWLSDGTWAEFSDALWGGSSTTEHLSLNGCAHMANPPTTPLPPRASSGESTIRYSGCGTSSGQVDQMAGLARHFGGGAAPLDLAATDRLSAWITSTHDVEVCLHSTHTPGQMPLCHTWQAAPLGAWRSLHPGQLDPLPAHVTPEHMLGIYLISFTINAPDASYALSVSHLELEPGDAPPTTTPYTQAPMEVVPGEVAPSPHLDKKPCATNSVSGQGCQTHPTSRPLQLAPILCALLWLMLLAPAHMRRRREDRR